PDPGAFDRREERAPGVATDLAEHERPAREGLDLGPGPQARPVGEDVADLAREHDRVTRVGASPQAVERGARPPGTGRRREREPRSHTREEAQRDQRPPAAADVGPGPQ